MLLRLIERRGCATALDRRKVRMFSGSQVGHPGLGGGMLDREAPLERARLRHTNAVSIVAATRLGSKFGPAI